MSNVKRCKSPWLCPVCSAVLAKLRAEKVQAVADAAIARGGAIALVVLTASHRLDTPLAAVKALVSDASNQARSHRAWDRLTDELGILGVIVAPEVTFSRVNGAHYHQHLAVVVDGCQPVADIADVDRGCPDPSRVGPPTRREARALRSAGLLPAPGRQGPPTLAELRALRVADAADRAVAKRLDSKGRALYGPPTRSAVLAEMSQSAASRAQAAGDAIVARYKAAIRDAGGTVSDVHGCRVRVADDAADASGYTAKGSSAWEIAGGHKDTTKAATSLTPWDLAHAAYAGDAWARSMWDQYAAAMPRTRSCIITKSLSKALGLLPDEDEEPGDEAFEESEGLVGTVSVPIWKSLMRQALAATFLARLETGAAAIVGSVMVADAAARAVESMQEIGLADATEFPALAAQAISTQIAGRMVFPDVAAWAVQVTADNIRRDDERRALALLPEAERYVLDVGADRVRPMTGDEVATALAGIRADIDAMGDLRREPDPAPSRPVAEDERAARRATADDRTRRHLIRQCAARVEARAGAGTLAAIERAIVATAAAVPDVAPPTVAELVTELARRQVESLSVAA